MNDEQAMWRVQMHDDAQAFAELVRRWEEPIRRLGVRILGDVHRAEDVAQEAFARVFTHRREFDPAARFSTWLWRIALNLCRDELRRRDRRRETPWTGAGAGGEEGAREPGEGPVPAAEPVSEGAGPAEETERLERAEAVRRAVLRLPEPYREVVALRHYEGLRFQEVAEVLGIPEGTVKSRMVEALDRLETFLRPWADEPASPFNR